jgi:hypothetical protein
VSRSVLLNFFFQQFHTVGVIGTKKINIIIYVLIAVLSMDTVINQLSGLLGISPNTLGGVSLFLVIGSMTIISQLFILHFVSNKSLGIRKKVRHIRRMHKAVTISQYSIIIIFVYVIIEIVLTESYSPISSMLVSMISYMLSMSLMGIFTIIFLSWYRSNRSSILVLIYGLSFATVVIASSALIPIWMHLFSEKISTRIVAASDLIFPMTEEGSIWKILGKIYQYSDIASFFLKWGGTALILYHYSHKIGRAKYWFLLSLPLVYFSTLLIYHFHIYKPHDELESLIFFGIASLNSTFGGILFYVAFKLTSENFKSGELIRDYLLMAGYGFMLFFSATQSSLVSTAYPPFGFATVSSYGLGSYLILFGLYLSALSVSHDNELRSMIRSSTLSESKFLHSIGTSSRERKKVIINTVIDKARQRQEKIIKDIGIGTSLTEEDIKNYVKEVEEQREGGNV